MLVHCCIFKFTSFQRDGRRCYEYLFACVKRNKMDSELLTCLLKFIEYFPDYLSALSRTLLRFFRQPLSKQLYLFRKKVNQSRHTAASLPGFNALIEVTEFGYGGLQPSAKGPISSMNDVTFDRAPRRTWDEAGLTHCSVPIIQTTKQEAFIRFPSAKSKFW